MKNKYMKTFLDGILFNNPTFVLVLGTCPTLAMTSNASDAFGMGISVIFVLTFSNIIISALRKVIPNAVRIPAFIVIIATLVTILKLFLNKFMPDLYGSMGTFLPLIVVNCIILGRAEAFASKNTVASSAIDGLANGIGFTISLVIMGSVREILGAGKWFGLKLWDFSIPFFSKPAGAFIVYGLSIALFVFIMDYVQRQVRIKKTRMLSEAQFEKEEA